MKNALELAKENLEARSIRDSTYRSYLQTLKSLDIEDVPESYLTPRYLTNRLSKITTDSTRRKHAQNLRAMFGVKLSMPRVTQKEYDLPDFELLHEAFKDSRYEFQAFCMLYAGMRLGEAIARQRISGTTIFVEKQRNPEGQILTAKSSGPVIVPEWFAAEYRKTKDFSKAHDTIYTGIKRRSLLMLGVALNPHALRHAFAMRLVESGANPMMLKAQMRHSKVETSLNYYIRSKSSDLQAMMDKF